MLSKELAKAINDQMAFEMYSAYVYLGLSAGLEKLKLPGAAHWMRMQAEEELIHANLFYDYLNDQDAEVSLGAIDKVSSKVKTAKEAFELALKHERLVTGRINQLCALAAKNNNYATLNYLNFFVGEQVQEEKSVQQIIDKYELAENSKEALLFIDKDLALRAAPTTPTIGQTN